MRNVRIPPEAVEHLSARDDRLAAVIAELGQIECRDHDDPFAYLVHTVTEQMMSTKVAAAINARVADLCAGDVTSGAVARLDAGELRSTGMSMRKAETVLNLARNWGSYGLEALSSASDAEVMRRITAIPGLGPWSAKMFLIFVLQREDVLPYEDGAFLQTYKWLYNARSTKPKTIERRCACWKPYRSIAARYLYRALDTGLTKEQVGEFLALHATRGE